MSAVPAKGFAVSSALLCLIALQARLAIWGFANPSYSLVSLATIALYGVCLTWGAGFAVRRLSLLYSVLVGALGGAVWVPVALFPDALIYAVQAAPDIASRASPLATVGFVLVGIYCAVGIIATAGAGAVWFGALFQAQRFAAKGGPIGSPLLACVFLAPWLLVSGAMVIFWTMERGPLEMTISGVMAPDPSRLQTASLVFWGTTLILSSVILLWALVALVVRSKR